MRFVCLLFFILLVLGCGTPSELKKADRMEKWQRIQLPWPMVGEGENSTKRNFWAEYFRSLVMAFVPSGGGVAFIKYGSNPILKALFLSWDYVALSLPTFYLGLGGLRLMFIDDSLGYSIDLLGLGMCLPITEGIAILLSSFLVLQLIPLPDEELIENFGVSVKLSLNFMFDPELVSALRVELPYFEVSEFSESELRTFFIGIRITSFLWIGGTPQFK